MRSGRIEISPSAVTQWVLLSLCLFATSLYAQTVTAPREVKIGGMFYTARSSTPNTVRGATGEGRTAFHLAIKRINEDPTLLPNTKLIGIEKNTNSGDLALTDSLKLSVTSECGLDETVVGIIGPAFSSYSIVAGTVGKVHKKPMISPSATSPQLNNPSLYPFFFRTIPADNQQGEALAAIASKLGWTKVCVVSTLETYGEEGSKAFTSAASELDISIIGSARLHDPDTPRSGDPVARKAEEDKFVEELADLEGTACRAIILFTNGELDLVLRALDRKGMSGPDFTYLGSEAVAMQYDNDFVQESTDLQQLGAGIIGTDPSKGSSQLKDEVTKYWADHVDTSTDDISNLFYDNGDKQLTTSGTVYAWDATYALARAIDATIRAGEDVFDGDTLKAQIEKLEFTGITGTVKFTGQNRDGGQYEIWNGWMTDGKPELVAIGKYDEASGVVTFAEESGDREKQIRWRSGQRGLEATPIDVQQDFISIPGGARIAFMIVCILGIIASVVCGLVYLAKRDLPLIRRSSPLFAYLILLGVIFAYTAVILFGVESLTRGLCATRTLLLLVAFTLSFGSLFAKTYRIHMIYNSPLSAGVTVVSSKQLLMGVSGLLALDIIIFTIWQIVSPYEAGESTVQEGAALFTTNVCESNNSSIFLALLFVVKAAVLIYGVYLAIRIRKVKQRDLNEAKWIAMCIWQVGFVAILAVPILFLIGSDVRNTVATYALMCLSIIIASTGLIGLMFGPKFYQIFVLKQTSGGEKEDKKVNVHRAGIGRGTEVAGAPKSKEQVLADELKAQKRNASELGDRVAELQRQLALSHKRETVLRETYEGTSALGRESVAGTRHGVPIPQHATPSKPSPFSRTEEKKPADSSAPPKPPLEERQQKSTDPPQAVSKPTQETPTAENGAAVDKSDSTSSDADDSPPSPIPAESPPLALDENAIGADETQDSPRASEHDSGEESGQSDNDTRV